MGDGNWVRRLVLSAILIALAGGLGWAGWSTDWGEFGAAAPSAPPPKYADEIATVLELRSGAVDLLQGELLTLSAGEEFEVSGVLKTDVKRWSTATRGLLPESRRQPNRPLTAHQFLAAAVSLRRWSSKPPGWQVAVERGGDLLQVDTHSRLKFSIQQEAPARVGEYEFRLLAVQTQWLHYGPQLQYHTVYSARVKVVAE